MARLIIILTFLLPEVLFAQVAKLGRSPYFMTSERFDCGSFFESVSELSDLRFAFLYNTPGRNFDCLKTAAADSRTRFVAIILINECCQEPGRRCGKYEILAGLSIEQYRAKIRKRDKALLAKISSYAGEAAATILPMLQPQTSCGVSYGLESHLSRKEAEILYSVLNPIFKPRCKAIWNPEHYDGKGLIRGADILEIHGDRLAPPTRVPYIVNLDGLDVDFVGRRSWLANKLPEGRLRWFTRKYFNAQYLGLWVAEDNLLAPGPFVDPRKRPGRGQRRAAREWKRSVRGL